MVWKNPFLVKNCEQQEKDTEYLALFDSSVLQMIEEQNLEKVSFVSSTPGAGKTSLFRAFSPRVLNMISKDENSDGNKQILQHMQRLGVIQNNKINLLSATLSCARSYSIIEEMFENGRRKQVLFALLNYRLIIVFLKSLCTILEIEIEDLKDKDVTFKEIPVEMMSEGNAFKNAYLAYKWACKGERELCKYLDSGREEKLELSFVHTTILAVKLFEGQNILIDGASYVDHSILILDDFHKLTERQKLVVSEALYTLKAKVGIWLGQRLEGLSNHQIVSMDGSLGRDYNPNIVIDNYWVDKSKRIMFYNILESIADKRVKEAGINNLRRFVDCLADKVETKQYRETLNEYILEIKTEIKEEQELSLKYSEVMKYIDENFKKDLFIKSLYYECLRIKRNRENVGQLEFYFGEQVDIEEIMDFYAKNKETAEFYVCKKCNIPFYYGLSRLQSLSSYNIEQFLFFSSEQFEGYRAKSLGNVSKRNAIRLTAEEQEKSVRKSVKQMWKDMDYRYVDIKRIKIFLSNIALYGIKSRDAERASYAGGAYTGFAIKNKELEEGLNDEKYSIVIKTLGECLASKYLERRDHSDLAIFYLNRWLCVYFDLPLAYGGWKKCNMYKLKEMCLNEILEEEDIQLTLDL